MRIFILRLFCINYHHYYFYHYFKCIQTNSIFESQNTYGNINTVKFNLFCGRIVMADLTVHF